MAGFGKKKRRVKRRAAPDQIELNIVPFIDVFSMLNTFLLFSAVFITTGITEVQIPFLSNAPPPKEETTRSLSINVDVEVQNIKLTSKFSMAPIDEQNTTYPNTKDGIKDMRVKLVQLRKQYADTDKVTLFSEDDVVYDNLSHILDAVKFRQEGDPAFPRKTADGTMKPDETYLFEKIVMGSVML